MILGPGFGFPRPVGSFFSFFFTARHQAHCCGYGTCMLSTFQELGVVVMPRAGSICCEPGCPNPAAYRGRCRSHAQEHERHQRATVATKRDEPSSREARRQTVAAWRVTHGDVCPGYRRPPHPARDLTAQHAHALADGGDPGQPLAVLCRSCNSRHGADRLAARRGRR